KGMVECTSDKRIGEFISTRVERKCLHDPDIVDREFREYYAFLRYRAEIIAGRPILCAIFHTPIDAIFLECLDANCCIPEILESKLLKVISSNVYIDSLAPIIWIAFVKNLTGRR